MYRTLYLVFLFFRTSFTAPQQSNIETIADVKPTIFDYPATVYDGIPQIYSPEEPRIINGGRQDSSSDDNKYDITTENTEVETTEYDEPPEEYERVTEFFESTDEYETGKKTPRFYSKLGYFLKPNYVEDKLNDLDETSNVKDKQDEEKQSYVEPSDIKTNSDTIVNKPNYFDNKPNFIENKSSFVEIKPNFIGVTDKEERITSLVQKGRRRKYISKCRCERIWNCPKLQITVPRCPNEYFMCCF